MPFCPNCGCPLSHSPAECLTYGSESRKPGDSFVSEAKPAEEDGLGAAGDRSVPIARFRNGAEAGYFAEELYRRAGIETEVVASEQFNGVHAAWSIDYLLMATTEDAAEGARALQDLVNDSGEEADENPCGDTERSELPGRIWMPLVLTLAAGSIACWGVERAEKRARLPALVDRDARLPPDLLHVLGSTPGIWRQQDPEGPAVRMLSVDSDERTAVLREDRDGDGTFDGEWQFDWRRSADR